MHGVSALNSYHCLCVIKLLCIELNLCLVTSVSTFGGRPLCTTHPDIAQLKR